MSNIWSGATPSAQVDANDYELGSVVCALEAVTLNGIRVWSPANAVTRTNRRGHVYGMDGTLLATITMTDALASGWTTHLLATPLSLDPGDMVVISYENSGNYGIVNSAFVSDPHTSADGAMCFPASRAVLVAGSSTHGNGRFHATPATAPNASFSTFYGVDADYTVVSSSGTAPTLSGLSLTADGLEVTAVIAASDPDGLTGATYSIDWGDGSTSSGSSASFSHTYTAGGIKAILASVTDSTSLSGYRAGAIQIAADSAGLDVTTILNALISHAMSLGRFDRVAGHEPKNAPGHGLTAAVWAESIAPMALASGLAVTSARVIFNVRIYGSAEQQPADAIDPNMVGAVDALMTAYSGDFTLGGLVRNVDLLGQGGPGLSAQAGYLEQDNKVFRVFTLTVPVIVNDVWSQEA